MVSPDLEGFAARLRAYREAAGGPSVRELETLTKAVGRPYSRSTIDDKLHARSFPEWEFVETFVRACARYAGVREAMVDLDGWRVAHQQTRTALAGVKQRQQDASRGAAAAARELARVPQEVVFEVARSEYLNRVRQRFQRVDLEILTPLTEQGEHPVMLLGQVFVPQSVRADPPPVELPREVWRRLGEAGQIDDGDLPQDLDRDRLEAARRAYAERPARPVLQVLSEPSGRKVVLLGDPGSGKSTLARYLMLALAGPPNGPGSDGGRHEAQASSSSAAGSTSGSQAGVRAPEELVGWLPLLVELRTYADPGWRAARSAGSGTFLDLIGHLHTTEDLGLPTVLLEDFLRTDGRAVVVFDGLDEVFDPKVRTEIARQIEGFAARYPRTRVVVTSRVIGYSRNLLDAAGFGHWMLQDLDLAQIRAFATTWYTSACPANPGEGTRLRDRLLTAVQASTAVGELAGNPMLLTILAIIGRRRELPRDRSSVYEHAVSVLIEHWDVDKHLRDVRIDAGMAYLDRKDKLELLHRVARGMQDAPTGLAGNHIPGQDLLEDFHNYLHERFDLPPDRAIPVARAMLGQFRERNFILARFGAEVYGFVHRAFLEYLAAHDINQRFTDRDLSEPDLLAVFDAHWPDPSWAEVLLLLTGMIPERFAATAITRLLDADPHWRVRPRQLPTHLLLALQAVGEVRKSTALTPHAHTITDALIALLETAATRESDAFDSSLAVTLEESLPRVLIGLGPTWTGSNRYQHWYRTRGRHLPSRASSTIWVAARLHVALLPRTQHDLMHVATGDEHPVVRQVAVQAIAAGWAEDPATLPWLRDRATTDEDSVVRQVAVQAINRLEQV